MCGEAADAKGVLEEVGEHRCDLVLLDWELPGLRPCLGKEPVLSDGRVISALRMLHPDILVVALSGRSEARLEAAAAGADEFISKGDPPENLLITLRGLLGKTIKTASKKKYRP